jgi:hypothetical protein
MKRDATTRRNKKNEFLPLYFDSTSSITLPKQVFE